MSNNIYFTALVETAAWGAELATELAGNGEQGHIYVVDPSGPFEDDPNVTSRRFLVNPTQAYRTPHLLRIVAELPSCDGEVEEPKRSHRPPICPGPIGMRGGAQTRTGNVPGVPFAGVVLPDGPHCRPARYGPQAGCWRRTSNHECFGPLTDPWVGYVRRAVFAALLGDPTSAGNTADPAGAGTEPEPAEDECHAMRQPEKGRGWREWSGAIA